MGAVTRFMLFLIFFVALSSYKQQETEALNLMNMFTSGANKKVTTTTTKPLEDDYEVEDLEDDDSDDVDSEDDGNSGLFAMLNPFVSLRKPYIQTNGHSKPEKHKPGIPIPENHYKPKPTFIVTKTLVHEVTRRITVHPVCVTAYGNKSPCLSDDSQHHIPLHPHGHQRYNENNEESMDTQYFISESEYGAYDDNAYLQPSEFTMYGFPDTDKEDIMITSRAARYLKMYTQTPTLISNHPIIISDQIEEDTDEDTEKWFQNAAKKTVTKTILATKIQRVPNLQVTATLVAQNCIPASYLSHPWCKEKHNHPTGGDSEDDAFEPKLDIRMDEVVLENEDASYSQDNVTEIPVNIERVGNLDKVFKESDHNEKEIAIEILSSELIPKTMFSSEEVFTTTRKEDSSFDEKKPMIFARERDLLPIQTVITEEKTHSEEVFLDMDDDKNYPNSISKNSKNNTKTDFSNSGSEKEYDEMLKEEDSVDYIMDDISPEDCITENINKLDVKTEHS